MTSIETTEPRHVLQPPQFLVDAEAEPGADVVATAKKRRAFNTDHGISASVGAIPSDRALRLVSSLYRSSRTNKEEPKAEEENKAEKDDLSAAIDEIERDMAAEEAVVAEKSEKVDRSERAEQSATKEKSEKAERSETSHKTAHRKTIEDSRTIEKSEKSRTIEESAKGKTPHADEEKEDSGDDEELEKEMCELISAYEGCCAVGDCCCNNSAPLEIIAAVQKHNEERDARLSLWSERSAKSVKNVEEIEKDEKSKAEKAERSVKAETAEQSVKVETSEQSMEAAEAEEWSIKADGEASRAIVETCSESKSRAAEKSESIKERSESVKERSVKERSDVERSNVERSEAAEKSKAPSPPAIPFFENKPYAFISGIDSDAPLLYRVKETKVATTALLVPLEITGYKNESIDYDSKKPSRRKLRGLTVSQNTRAPTITATYDPKTAQIAMMSNAANIYLPGTLNFAKSLAEIAQRLEFTFSGASSSSRSGGAWKFAWTL